MGVRMKVALLVVGIVLLLIGIGGAFWGLAVASGAETAYALTCTTGGPEPYPGWCASLLSSASTYRTLAYGMVAVFIIGVVMAIAGAVMKEAAVAPLMMPAMAPPQPAPPPGPDRMCKNCGRSVPPGNRFCPNCGSPQS